MAHYNGGLASRAQLAQNFILYIVKYCVLLTIWGMTSRDPIINWMNGRRNETSTFHKNY
jgi:hypothetical protein